MAPFNQTNILIFGDNHNTQSSKLEEAPLKNGPETLLSALHSPDEEDYLINHIRARFAYLGPFWAFWSDREGEKKAQTTGSRDMAINKL